MRSGQAVYYTKHSGYCCQTDSLVAVNFAPTTHAELMVAVETLVLPTFVPLSKAHLVALMHVWASIKPLKPLKK